MENEPPKASSWNYDSQDIHKSVEFEKPQAVSWSEVAKNMNNDARESLTARWYFNVPIILALLLFSKFISSLIGAILILLYMTRVILSAVKSNSSPSKTSTVIFWIVTTVILLVLALL
jgi:hypothetical protein